MKRKQQRGPRPPSGPGPATNRRLANRPLPARARTRFMERGPASECADVTDIADQVDDEQIPVDDE